MSFLVSDKDNWVLQLHSCGFVQPMACFLTLATKTALFQAGDSLCHELNDFCPKAAEISPPALWNSEILFWNNARVRAEGMCEHFGSPSFGMV